MSLLQEVQSISKKTVPIIRTGYTVKVHQKIKEGEKERIQIFEGLVIKVNSGHGADKTMTVRKVVEGIGVEKIFPIYSTNIAKIDVVKIAKIRRAKLYYMRDRSGKSARLKEIQVNKDGVPMEIVEEPVLEGGEMENTTADDTVVENTTSDEAVAEEVAKVETEEEVEEAKVEAEEEKPAEEAKLENTQTEETKEDKKKEEPA